MEKSLRLRKNRDYQTVFKSGKSYWNKNYTILLLKNDLCTSRIGFTVTKKYGTAVVRNRIRRRLKEIVRNNKHTLVDGYDIVIIPKKNTESMSYGQLEDSLKQLFAFISKKQNHQLGKRKK